MDPLIGEIRLFAFNFVPEGWMACQGQELPVQHHEALFALIGDSFGGNGYSTFRLPNLQGRAPIGQGRGSSVPTTEWGQAVDPPLHGLVEGDPQDDPDSPRWRATPGFLSMSWCIAVQGIFPARA